MFEAVKSFEILKSPLKGKILIEASAGTGKTFTIVSLFLRLLIEKKFLINEILIVTFTKAATEELRNRTRIYLNKALKVITGKEKVDPNDELLNYFYSHYKDNEKIIFLIKQALINFDQAAIFTIHAFCQKILTEHAFETNSIFETELTPNQTEILNDIINDFWRKEFYEAPSFLINYATQKSFNSERLLQLALGKSLNPFLKIIPKPTKINLPSLEKESKKLDEFYYDLKKTWPKIRPLVEIFFTKIYKERFSSSRINGMDKFIEADNPFAEFKQLKFFLKEEISKKKEFIDQKLLLFFTWCQRLFNQQTKFNNLIEQYLINFKINFLNYLQRELKNEKEIMNLQTYDDLLEKIYNSLKKNSSPLAPIIRQKYPVALIDEFQDTDFLQYQIFSKIYEKNSTLFLIGDPKQAIYRFRGADIFAYLESSSQIDYKYTLDINWRSNPSLIKGVNAIWTQKENPFIFEKINFEPVKPPPDKQNSDKFLLLNGSAAPPIQVYLLEGDQKISKEKAAKLISQKNALEINRLIELGQKGRAFLGQKKVQPQDIAILVRKNRQAQLIQNELTQLAVPSIIYSNQSIFASEEAQELSQIMGAIINSRNKKMVKIALLTGILPYSVKEILDSEKNNNLLEKVLIRFHDYYQLWLKTDFMIMFQQLLTREKIIPKLFSFYNGERRLTNLFHLAEILQETERQEMMSPERLKQWLKKKIKQDNLSEENQLRLETDQSAVKIITIHKSKGMEYPIVFLPFLWDSLGLKKESFYFHNPDDNYNLTLDLGSRLEKNYDSASKEILAEDIRLLYVALTRAKSSCYIFGGDINKAENSAFAYIFGARDDKNSNLSNQIKKNLDKIKQKTPECIEIYSAKTISDTEIIPDPQKISGTKNFNSALFTSGTLNYRIFDRSLTDNWSISSFSALTSSQNQSLTPNPLKELTNNSPLAPKKQTEDIFSFPKGPLAGNCIHAIFENIDFSLKDKNFNLKTIKKNLEIYNFKRTPWAKILKKMIDDVLKTPLSTKNDLQLKKINPKNKITELEFYFPFNQVTNDNLSKIFLKHGRNDYLKSFSEDINKLKINHLKGFLKGFIDLVFCYQDKFYVLDWKSNFLGDNLEDYKQFNLKKVMKSHYYLLQYHLYSLALHQYLQMRLPNYNYQKHFGGIYYLFIRGMRPSKPGYGIYYDYPNYILIEALKEYLKPNEK